MITDVLELKKNLVLFIKHTLYRNGFQNAMLDSSFKHECSKIFYDLSVYVLCELASKLCEFDFW